MAQVLYIMIYDAHNQASYKLYLSTDKVRTSLNVIWPLECCQQDNHPNWSLKHHIGAVLEAARVGRVKHHL